MVRQTTSRESGDAELFHRAFAGDSGALGVLYDRYAADVWRVVARLGVPAAEVDDIVQSTFLELLRAGGRYDGRDNGKPWLIGLAVMLVRRHRRSLARLAARLTLWAREPATAPVTPEAHANATEAARRAELALSRLSPAKREAFVLIALEGMSGEEAASIAGVPLRTIFTRLHHARRELRAALEETG